MTEFTLHAKRRSADVDALAVSPDGNRLYASNDNSLEHNLLVYGRFAQPKTVPALTPVLGAAVLQGTVNPEGLPVEGCQFEWGEGEPGGSFEHSVPCAQTPAEIGAGEAPVPVTAELGGLTPYNLYHYRLVARNATGTTHGEDLAMSASFDVFGFQLGGADALEINASDPNALAPSIEEGVNSNGERAWQVANPQAPDSQAGSHPFDVTTRFVVNSESDGVLPLGMRPKDYYTNLPAGFPRQRSEDPTLQDQRTAVRLLSRNAAVVSDGLAGRCHQNLPRTRHDGRRVPGREAAAAGVQHGAGAGSAGRARLQLLGSPGYDSGAAAQRR